ncbi:unnamed protein product [Microthlaspi erraticum]|uniref:RNase H type-1 domain-containing protein n=1 Tax=Microthlaspi erraticum TaxID=1685480 RepID=A0A6D2HSU2_9BRAS|nr:unnamed protein product [Microthlaspi erraticum]
MYLKPLYINSVPDFQGNWKARDNMKSHLSLALIGAFAIIVGAQTQEGFISLDCGLPIGESPYNDPYNGLTFTSDSNFIQTGESGKFEKDFNKGFSRQYLTMRYFPEGKRNCYSLDVKSGTNYDILVSFGYGNYDGLNLYPNFDIYLGPNKWTRIDLEVKPNGIREEIIHKAKSNSLDICLVKTGTTVPLISAIEIRPMRNDTYVTHSGSLRLSHREYYSRFGEQIRDTNISGSGWIFIDYTGTEVLRGQAAERFVSSPLLAEALAIRYTLNHTLEDGISNILVNSDALDLIRAIITQEKIKEIYGLLFDIQTLASLFSLFSFRYISRSENVVADSIAKIAKSRLVDSITMRNPLL